ncbi:unnamed protein product [Arabidopsis halleri]
MLWLEPAQRYYIFTLDSDHYVYNSMAMYVQFRKEPLTVGGKIGTYLGCFFVVVVLFLRIISKLCREEAKRKSVFGN